MTDNLPDDAALEDMFRMPQFLAEEPFYVALHTDVIARLRREAQGLPMLTSQHMMIERMAAIYIVTRYKEDTNQWRGNAQDLAAKQLLALQHEFHAMLVASRDELREKHDLEMQQIVIDLLNEIQDDDLRRTLRRTASEKFAEIGQ